MDKKTTRRIIGVLVMIALVIIILPLIISGRTTPALQTAEVKAPPFPEPQNETDPIPTSMIVKNAPLKHVASKSSVATKFKGLIPLTSLMAKSNLALPPSQTGKMIKHVIASENTPQTEKTVVSNTTAAPSPNPFVKEEIAPTETHVTTAKNTDEAFPATPVITTALEAKDEIEKAQLTAIEDTATKKPAKTLDDPVLVVDREGAVNVVSDGTAPSVEPSTTIQSPRADNTVVSKTTKPKSPVKQVAVAKAKTLKIPAAIPANTISENLSNLKKTAWVVQMGSFRSKENAMHLTNRLRAKGYKAFTYETKSNGQTRVYVGPEFKQASAAILVNRIQQEVDMQGVIVSYNPLAL